MPETESRKPNRVQRRHPTRQSMLGDIMNSNEVSAETGIPRGTLRYWRALGDQGPGPRWFRIGDRKIAYLRSDVERWLSQQYESA